MILDQMSMKIYSESFLSEVHKQHLQKDSAISSKVIDLANLKSVSASNAKFLIGKEVAGLAFPYLDFQAKIIGLRMRVDNPIPMEEKPDKLIKYLQKRNTNLHCYFVQSSIEEIMNENAPLYVTEGEKKLLSLISMDEDKFKSSISIPGAWNFKRRDDEGFGQVLNDVPMSGRKLFLIPDTDYFNNPMVQSGWDRFSSIAQEKGALLHRVDLR